MKGVLVSEVVNFILVLGDQHDDGDPIPPLKLQKLLYYCQGFNLGAYNHPLFKEDIEAWEHGPVVFSVWRSYRIYGSRAIDVPEPLLNTSISDEQMRLAEKVYNAYGQYSAWKLRDLTHQEPPWQNTPRNHAISHKLMRAHFRTKIRRTRY